MAEDNTTRWTVTVSRETDSAVRSFLAQRGLNKGDLSRFVEEAVRWRVFDLTTAEAREAFAGLAPDALHELVNEAAAAGRNDMRKTLSRTFRKES
jgi:hypothetical protein